MNAKSYKLKYTPDDEQLVKDLSAMSEELQYKPMTYEEALRILRYFPYFLVSGRANGKTTLEYRRFEAFCKAFEALEKQIPKKPLHMHKNYYCPICKEDGWMLWDDAIPNDMDKYCGKCGQAIDWEV